MTKQEIIEVLNDKFKEFFKGHGFKVRREGSGAKATRASTTLSFYIECDKFASWFRDEHEVDCEIYGKIPFSDYEVVSYRFKLDENDLQHNIDTLDRIFSDPEFVKLIDWSLPEVIKYVRDDRMEIGKAGL